jgi:thioester reductase-like protein
MGYTLLTGATGLLGRYLMRDLMDDGAKLAVLVRPSRKKNPRVRIEAAMRSWEEQLGRSLPRPVVLDGDINQPDFGLPADQIKWAAENCDALLHNAASLAFVTTGRDAEPYRSNVDGVKNVIEFCRQASIEKFFQVSTAYIAGKRSGRCFETELNVGQEFSNCYEESKLEAEELVRAAGFDSLTVFRPGIIVGDSQTGMTTTFHNFYASLQLAHTLVAQMGQFDETGFSNAKIVKFNLDGSERKNLVPVDWVSAVMSWIIMRPELHGQTYHLTPRVPITVRLMRDVIEAAVGIYGVEFYGSGNRRSEDRHEAEDLFFEHMQVYSSYWRDDPEYDSTNTQKAAPHLPCPHIDRALLLSMAKAAINQRFQWKDPVVAPTPQLATVS